MKKIRKSLLAILVAVSLLFASCGVEKHGIEREATGWDQGKQVFTEFTYVEPTWSDAFQYSFQSGYVVSLIVGLLILAFAVLIGVARAKDHKILGDGFLYKHTNIILFVVAALSIPFIYNQPAKVRFDNVKKISVDDLKHYQEVGFNVYWDSVYSNNKLIGANSK